jgi:hypothetical protein
VLVQKCRQILDFFLHAVISAERPTQAAATTIRQIDGEDISKPFGKRCEVLA